MPMKKSVMSFYLKFSILESQAWHDQPERHHNATSNGCPEHTNHEEEDGTPTARTPTATFHNTVSCSVIRKHKGRSKQNATVPH